MQLHQLAGVVLVQAAALVGASGGTGKLRLHPLVGILFANPFVLSPLTNTREHLVGHGKASKCALLDLIERELLARPSRWCAAHRGGGLGVVEVEHHGGGVGGRGEQVLELAQHMGADRLLLIDHLGGADLSGIDIEVIAPEVHEHLLELFLTLHRTNQLVHH